MEQRSIFFDEWIKSLREQYKYVVRNNDTVTLPSLTEVMHNVGFTDDDLAQLRVEATMHIDDVGVDYVPDMKVLDTTRASQPHPDECTCPQCIPIDESQFDDEGQLLTDIDPEQATTETGHVFSMAKIEDGSEDDNPEIDIEDNVTFEDHLAEESAETEDVDSIEELDDEDDEDDPNAPQQMSMF